MAHLNRRTHAYVPKVSLYNYTISGQALHGTYIGKKLILQYFSIPKKVYVFP